MKSFLHRPIFLTLSLILIHSISLAATDALNYFSFENSTDATVNGIAGKYLSSPASFPVHLDAAEPWSIEFWTQVDQYPEEHFGNQFAPMTLFILEPSDRTSTALYARINKGKLFLTYYRKPISAEGVMKHNLFGIADIPEKSWNHIMICCNAAGETTVYLNGKADSFGKPGVSLPEWNSIHFGSEGRGRLLIGGIDEFRIHNRCFDATQVKEIYKGLPHSKTEAVKALPDSKTVRENFYGRYPALKVSSEEFHPLIDQLDITATLVPWYGTETKDLLIRGSRPLFGYRQAVYKYLGQHNGLPVYDQGTDIHIPGTHFQSVPGNDGLFDLYAQGQNTAYGNGCLIHYRNLGCTGAPEFSEPRQVSVGGQYLLPDVLGEKQNGWCIKDIDGDKIPDLLINVTLSLSKNNWPFDGAPWNGKVQKNAGKGKGYDIVGKWLGSPVISELRWAKGYLNDNRQLNFHEPKEVFHIRRGNILRLSGADRQRAVNTISIRDTIHLLLSGDVDKIYAMLLESDGEDIICGPATNLLANGPAMTSSYFPAKLMVQDLDGDGMPEILADGNPGTIAVFKGSHPGSFRDIGPALTQGGFVAGETLVSPCRIDWDGDGNQDLLLGDSSGWLTFWPGTKDPLVYGAPAYMTAAGERVHHQAGLSTSIQGPTEQRWGYLKVTAGDWDEDGVPEIITGDIGGELTLYEAGTSGTDLQKPQAFTLNGQPFKIAWRSRPAIVDRCFKLFDQETSALLIVDWDGEAAVAFPATQGGTDFSEVIKLKYENGKNMVMSGGCGLWGRAAMTVCDWDEDGRWDILVGTSAACQPFIFPNEIEPHEAAPIFLRNVGTNSNPVFADPVFIKLKSGEEIEVGAHNATVWPADLDGNGKNDLLIGAEDGKVYRFFREDLAW